MGMTGIELIASERRRQVMVEGWTPEHDDEHKHGELSMAARAYCGYASTQIRIPHNHEDRQLLPYGGWPWDAEWWKPSPDPLRNLVKAGALIAAEIDRLQRKVAGTYGVTEFDPNTGCRPASDCNEDGSVIGAPFDPPPVDRSARVLASGAPVPEDYSHTEINPLTGQQREYVVLTEDERSKGFVRPYRDAYRHLKCGSITTMSRSIADTFRRDPYFYTGTFCIKCCGHFPIGEDGEFRWYEMNGTEGPKVGT